MARQSKPLPQYIESVNNTDLQCAACTAVFKKASLASHLQSQKHIKNVANAEEENQRERYLEARANAAESSAERSHFACLADGGEVAGRSSFLNLPDPPSMSAREEAMWDDFLENGADFTMDDDKASAEEEREKLERVMERAMESFGICDAERSAFELGFQFGKEQSQEERLLDLAATPEEDAILADLLSGTFDPLGGLHSGCDLSDNISGLGLGGLGGDSANSQSEPDPRSECYPYPNYPTFLLDVIDNILRTPISDSLLKLFIFVMHESGVKAIPSFSQFRKLQAKLRTTCGVPTIPCTSPQGHRFFIVDPRVVLGKDWANKTTRKHIHVYPEIPDGPIREVWHTTKWHGGIDPSSLSPMYDAGEKHYYVGEVTQLVDGSLVLPVRWVVYHGEVHADVHAVIVNANGTAVIDYDHARMVPVSSLKSNYFDLEAGGTIPCWDEHTRLPQMPNPLRNIAGGDPLYSSFVNHFADDVSGNRSKSWNKHYNAYMSHANLSRHLLQQEAHVHFVSTSPHASAPEQFYAFKQVVESTHSDPVRVIDALTGRPARFRIFVHAEPSDNPMQSEISGHIGSNGNLPCRKCKVGGTTLYKESDEGFHALFMPGEERDRDKILSEVKAQLHLACLGVASHVKSRQTEHGVKDAYSQYWIDDLIVRAREAKKANPARSEVEIQQDLIQWVDAQGDQLYNPFLTLRELDPTKDTPIEVLHTILLGIVKYAWHQTHTSWSDTQKTTFAQRLQATNTDNLSTLSIRAQYIMQYANSLIGRQLKTVVQATAFHVYDMLPKLKFHLWLAVGELTALLWFPEIKDKAIYRLDLEIAIANVLDIFAEIDPTKILEKIKLHILVHAPEDATRFGPLIGMATETFESFNAIFRNASIHSNHRSPSQDIARRLADQESLKHRLLGTVWTTPDGETRQAGPQVRDFLKSNPTMQGLIGWTETAQLRPGTFKLAPIPKGMKTAPTVMLHQTLAISAVNVASFRLDSTWTCCKYLISAAEDICSTGSWICAQSPVDPSKHIMGRIEAIFADPHQGNAIAIVDVFEVAGTRHPILNMPYLVRRQDERAILIVQAPAIKFAFNVQHDCTLAGCSATGKRFIQEEREETTLLETFVEHKTETARYIINMHSLHNPHLIRSFIPRALVAPEPRWADRRAAHDRIAHTLREGREQKRAANQARREAKKAGATNASTQQGGGTQARPLGAEEHRAGLEVPGESELGGLGSTASSGGARKRRRLDSIQPEVAGA